MRIFEKECHTQEKKKPKGKTLLQFNCHINSANIYWQLKYHWGWNFAKYWNLPAAKYFYNRLDSRVTWYSYRVMQTA